MNNKDTKEEHWFDLDGEDTEDFCENPDYNPFKCECGGYFEIIGLATYCTKCFKIIPMTIPEGMTITVDFYPKQKEEEED